MYHINNAIQISLSLGAGYDVTIVTNPSFIATNFSRLQRASNLSAAFAKVLKWPVMQVVITDAASGLLPWKSRNHPRNSRKSLSVISSIVMMSIVEMYHIKNACAHIFVVVYIIYFLLRSNILVYLLITVVIFLFMWYFLVSGTSF